MNDYIITYAVLEDYYNMPSLLQIMQMPDLKKCRLFIYLFIVLYGNTLAVETIRHIIVLQYFVLS